MDFQMSQKVSMQTTSLFLALIFFNTTTNIATEAKVNTIPERIPNKTGSSKSPSEETVFVIFLKKTFVILIKALVVTVMSAKSFVIALALL